MISAKIVADSLAPNGVRLTTLSLVYPRFIHSEFMTHRVFSRNAASSRAIPVQRVMAQLRDNPAMPVYWGKNQKGMQAAEELDMGLRGAAQEEWLLARDSALRHVAFLEDLGLHKQTANRLLEPWALISTIVTATEWDNFYNLRADPMAQPEFRVLAEAMLGTMNDSDPMEVPYNYWHMPYVTEDERDCLTLEQCRKCSVARCARVSYNNHDNDKPPDPKADAERHDSLLTSGHVSPFEHQAMPNTASTAWSGNFRGWIQYRKLMDNPFETSSKKLHSKVKLSPEEKLYLAIFSKSEEVLSKTRPEVVELLAKGGFSTPFIETFLNKHGRKLKS